MNTKHEYERHVHSVCFKALGVVTKSPFIVSTILPNTNLFAAQIAVAFPTQYDYERVYFDHCVTTNLQYSLYLSLQGMTATVIMQEVKLDSFAFPWNWRA